MDAHRESARKEQGPESIWIKTSRGGGPRAGPPSHADGQMVNDGSPRATTVGRPLTPITDGQRRPSPAQIAARVPGHRLGGGAARQLTLGKHRRGTARPEKTGKLPVVHPIASEAWPLIASRHVSRHHAGPPRGGRPARRQITAALDSLLAAARREPLAWSLAAARRERQARNAARRVEGADPAGPAR
jgi:hypothetical protein